MKPFLKTCNMKKALVLKMAATASIFAVTSQVRASTYAITDAIDSCTSQALVAAAEKFDHDQRDYRQFRKMEVVEGDQTRLSGISYLITFGSPQAGETVYLVKMKPTNQQVLGSDQVKATCVATSIELQ